MSIIIDAGHGGKDNGAVAFGLKEKDIALDIARRTRQFLQKKGFRAYITRSTDHFLSLVNRVQLARQLKAGLFVSVHVNSFPGLQKVSGVETHFFDDRYLWGKDRKISFVFANGKNDKKLIEVANSMLKHKIDESQTLSTCIQKSVIDIVHKDYADVVDRGIRRTGLRTLFRCETPASFVEVGFLTNKAESQRMAKTQYRELLAQGICNGIMKYFSS